MDIRPNDPKVLNQLLRGAVRAKERSQAREQDFIVKTMAAMIHKPKGQQQKFADDIAKENGMP